jgi:sugar lactone lactonase YvrE
MPALLLADTVQVVAEGFGWVEGPLWVSDALESREYLLFSDVKANRLWKWEEGSGLFTIGTSVLLERSGCRYALLLLTCSHNTKYFWTSYLVNRHTEFSSAL